MRFAIDHLTIVASDLAEGAAMVERALGVAPQAGGKHSSMGTHNLLLSLGASSYLEVIAVDPDAPSPTRPRWFALDALKPGTPPRLATWVARTADIHASCTAWTTSTSGAHPIGRIEPMSRGPLSWLITITADGALPMAGVLPTLIEWPAGVHPCAVLPSSGCTLLELELHHPEPGLVQAHLDALGAVATPPRLHLVQADEPALLARIQTPLGIRTLGLA